MELNPNKPTEEETEEMSDTVREEKILPHDLAMQIFPLLEIGRASCRERVFITV